MATKLLARAGFDEAPTIATVRDRSRIARRWLASSSCSPSTASIESAIDRTISLLSQMPAADVSEEEEKGKEQESGEDWKRRSPYFESIKFASIAVRTGGSTKGRMPGGIGISEAGSAGSGGSNKAVGITALVLSGIAVLVVSVVIYR